jgi:hypothetical protein
MQRLFAVPSLYSKKYNMKKHFLILMMVLFTMNRGNAQSCQSLFSGAEKIFNNLVQDYIEFRMEAAQVFVDFIIPGKPGAEAELDKLFNKATKLQTDLYRSYGIITGESNATIGAINLVIPVKKWTGTCYTERTFLILNSPYDKVVIKVKKTDGKRGLKMAACAKYSNGSLYDKIEREIDNGKETAGQERTFTFGKDMLNKNITLHLVASGALPTDKCGYTLSVETFFDENEMKDIAKKNPPAQKTKEKITVSQPVKNEIKKVPVNNN